MVTGELRRKEFIMAKLSGVNFGKAVKNTGNSFKAKVERNTVAIVGEKGIVLCTNGADLTNLYQNESVVDGAIEALTDLLNSIPDSTETLLDKPYRVVLPRVIGGLATGSFLDWVRTGKTISSGEVIPQERLTAYANIMKLMATKYGNVELVADRFATQEDKKVSGPAWDALKAEIASIVRGTSSIVSAGKPAVSAEDQARLAELKAKLAKVEDELLDAEDEETEAKLEKKVAKLQSMIARALANSGQKAEESDEEPQVADDIKGLF